MNIKIKKINDINFDKCSSLIYFVLYVWFFTLLNFDINKITFKNSLNKIAHRGPDYQDFYFANQHYMYLGHNRLSIIDIENGNQPFWSEDKNLVILFNGEIYNYLSIKKITK